MAIVPLSCANCGAPLEAPEHARFLTCGHCGTRLRQERSGSAVYTELVDQVAQVASSARDIAEGVSRIAAHHRIEALDREWEETRRGHLIARASARNPIVGLRPALLLLLSGA